MLVDKRFAKNVPDFSETSVDPDGSVEHTEKWRRLTPRDRDGARESCIYALLEMRREIGDDEPITANLRTLTAIAA